MRLTIFLAAIVIAAPLHATAQNTNHNALIENAKQAVAVTLNKLVQEVDFKNLKVSEGQSTVVCGLADGRRFVSTGADASNKPSTEKDLGPSIFNYLWNLRCEGMTTDAAIGNLKSDLKENICTIEKWDGGVLNETQTRIVGTASCKTGRLQITAFNADTNESLGTTEVTITNKEFVADFPKTVPKGTKVKIKYLTGK